MAKFLSELDVELIDDGKWRLKAPLRYFSNIVGVIVVPAGFETDFASVPRVPFVYMAFGDRAHRESVLHDYLYRTDSIPPATFDQANDVFLEAMTERGKGWFVRKMMYWGVCCGGSSSYHRKKVEDKL